MKIHTISEREKLKRVLKGMGDIKAKDLFETIRTIKWFYDEHNMDIEDL
ncbi:hypothetical protein [Caldicellulosiruptor morganii]|uniref:Uncharacterized protein n=1 Tax=Caldicellulosiruptor morganii TaxID=1387555 RepID=A0ABY7BP70_9FIRM|nr:hypothetical protein [Caldicellulosiruptor morganii]WAM33555.1 hypothetical protein OTK00_002064 [Caldicellulosiruptor morganii]